MSRRRSSGDQEFGSDSFLDIIANIVGILIILIVVAGAKVARQPALDATTAAHVSPPLKAAQPINEEIDQGFRPDVSDIEPMTEPVAKVRLDDPFIGSEVSPEASPWDESVESEADLSPLDVFADEEEQLSQQIEELTLQLDDIRSNTASTEAELQTLLDQQQVRQELAEQKQTQSIEQQDEETRVTANALALQEQLDQANNTARSIQTTLTSLTDRQRYISDALKQVTTETRQLQEVLKESDDEPAAGERLNHRLSPVSQAVTDDELHFRLHQGRIAHIPLDKLLERLKSQVSARRSVIMRFHRYEGVVGPVGGFRMQYTVQRQSVSPLQALQYGQNAYRISVARWTIAPADTLRAEPVETALQIGSRYRQIMEAADPDTVVTIWLYPDDFQHFHELREFAHRLNLRVAARPLPDGTAIAGSPNGSRSSSQ